MLERSARPLIDFNTFQDYVHFSVMFAMQENFKLYFIEKPHLPACRPQINLSLNLESNIDFFSLRVYLVECYNMVLLNPVVNRQAVDVQWQNSIKTAMLVMCSPSLLSPPPPLHPGI